MMPFGGSALPSTTGVAAGVATGVATGEALGEPLGEALGEALGNEEGASGHGANKCFTPARAVVPVHLVRDGKQHPFTELTCNSTHPPIAMHASLHSLSDRPQNRHPFVSSFQP